MSQNLLIVDDEWEILTWLEELFRYDFDRDIEVYIANSAPEALGLLNRVKFDVVLTDIRMPSMDGITLFYKIKENWPRCRVVFLTGYRNFDNVYELIRHKDIRYILKSESDEAIQDTVRQVLDEIESDLAQEEIRRQRERTLEIANHWIRREVLASLLSGDDMQCEAYSAKKAEDPLQGLDVPLDLYRDVLLFIFRIDPGSNHHLWQGQLTLLEELAAILPDSISEKIASCSYIKENRHIYLFIQPKSEETNWESTLSLTLGGLEYAQNVFHKVYKNTFSAAYTAAPVSRQELPRTANGLRQTLVSFVGENSEMILMANPEEYHAVPAASADTLAQVTRFNTFLELRKRKEHYELLLSLSEEFQGKSLRNPFALGLYYSIALLLLQFITNNNLYERIAFHVGLYKLTKVDEHDSWGEATQYLLNVSEAIYDLLTENENTLSDRALSRIITYINGNISKDLSLTTLAAVGGFNASYLSRLFRQLVGMTITDYITKKRLDLSKEFLEHTTEKVQDISAKCGYSSSHSFSRAFRNAVGISPAEYREMHRGQP